MPLNSSTTFATLAREKVDRYRSMGAFGKPAYQNHVQLKAMLRAKRGDKFANYLSKPSYDPDAGELRWTAEVPGEARRWSELAPDEKGRLALELEVVRSGLIGFVRELRTQGGNQPGGATAFATLLEQAMRAPAQEFLYFVGSQPMVAFWGFEDQNGHSVDPSAVAPRYDATASSTPAAAGAGAAAVGAAGAAVTRKRPWWHWLLWALLALLLVLALLFGLRACAPGSAVDPSRLLPGAASAPDAARPGASGVDGGSLSPQIGGSTGGVSGSSGGSTVDGSGSSGVDPAAPGASAPDGRGPADALDKEAGNPPKDPEKPDPAASGARPADKPDPAQDPKDDPKHDPKKDDKKDPKARTDPPLPPDPKALKIPPNPADAKKMDFLEGDWRAGEGLADAKTQQPLDLSVKFGKDGKGEITLKRADGSTCKGSVQGRMNGGKLSVDGSQAIPCSNGGTYAPPKIECAPDTGGQTPCVGVNPDGSRYNMGMRRQ